MFIRKFPKCTQVWFYIQRECIVFSADVLIQKRTKQRQKTQSGIPVRCPFWTVLVSIRGFVDLLADCNAFCLPLLLQSSSLMHDQCCTRVARVESCFSELWLVRHYVTKTVLSLVSLWTVFSLSRISSLSASVRHKYKNIQRCFLCRRNWVTQLGLTAHWCFLCGEYHEKNAACYIRSSVIISNVCDSSGCEGRHRNKKPSFVRDEGSMRAMCEHCAYFSKAINFQKFLARSRRHFFQTFSRLYSDPSGDGPPVILTTTRLMTSATTSQTPHLICPLAEFQVAEG